MAIYCGRKSDLEKFNRTYLPKDLIIEFNDDGSDKTVRMKTGRENYSAPYLKLPYLTCGCSNKNKYVYTTDIEKNTWLIHHNLKGRPIIQLYNSKDEIINGEIHYIDENSLEVIFSEPVKGYAVCIYLTENGYLYYGSGSVWTIKHNLEGKPFTQVFDNQGKMINAEVKHLDNNTTQISFFSGREYNVIEDYNERKGYRTEMGDTIPYSVTGFAVLILDPSSQYIHKQEKPSTTWEIRHNLNNYCIIQLINPDLWVFVSEIKQINKSIIRVTFSEPVAGEAICVTFNPSDNNSHMGCIQIVKQYELPDVKVARTNTLYVIRETGFGYLTDDNFQWITLTPGPSRIDGNRFPDDNPDMETDGNKWSKHEWED